MMSAVAAGMSAPDDFWGLVATEKAAVAARDSFGALLSPCLGADCRSAVSSPPVGRTEVTVGTFGRAVSPARYPAYE
jgi:hypothetical protein